MPWQRFAPLRSGPAVQVELAAGEQECVERVIGRRAATEATMPGAPWHHCVRIAPLSSASAPPRVGGQFACSPARTAVADSAAVALGASTSGGRSSGRRASAAITPAKPWAGPRISFVEP